MHLHRERDRLDHPNRNGQRRVVHRVAQRLPEEGVLRHVHIVREPRRRRVSKAGVSREAQVEGVNDRIEGESGESDDPWRNERQRRAQIPPVLNGQMETRSGDHRRSSSTKDRNATSCGKRTERLQLGVDRGGRRLERYCGILAVVLGCALSNRELVPVESSDRQRRTAVRDVKLLAEERVIAREKTGVVQQALPGGHVGGLLRVYLLAFRASEVLHELPTT